MRRIELLTGFETTYLPLHDRDVAETTEHDIRVADDLRLVAAQGVTRLRYPVRWHRVEARPGVFDWRGTDAALDALRSEGLSPIVDLVHHTSYPAWLRDGFADPRFSDAYLRYVEAFCRRYEWVEEYTLFNEPFSTLFLCGHEGIWPPFHRGMRQFVQMCVNVLPALAEASRLARRLLPAGRHVWVDACEHHTGAGGSGEAYCAFANDRRWFVLDAMLGRLDDGFARPFVRQALRAGGGALARIEPGTVDVVGLDYYAHCQWHFTNAGGSVPTPRPRPLAEQIAQYAQRYERPVLLSETNIRGTASDRAAWLKYCLEQCERAAADGVDIDGLCWFPFIDSADWDSLLYRCEGSIDPVGVFSLDTDRARRATTMSDAFRAAVAGGSDAIPAYTWQVPVSTWLRGYEPHVRHWERIPPPERDIDPDAVHYDMELSISEPS